jgi:hypothetical protein
MRSIDSEWGEDEVVDLGGCYLYQVQYGQSRKKLVKSKHDPKDKFGYVSDIFKHYCPYVDGRLNVFFEDKLVGSFWIKDGGLHNPYGPAKILFKRCGNMSFSWALDDKRYVLRDDKIVHLSGSVRMGKTSLFVTKQHSDHGSNSFFIKDGSKTSKYYFDVYGELVDEYKKY